MLHVTHWLPKLAVLALLATPVQAGNLEPAPCHLLKSPAAVRECLLSREVEHARVQGDRLGAANSQVLGGSLSQQERLSILRARQQMAGMAVQREQVLLGAAGSGGGIGVFAPLLLLLGLFGLGGGGGSSGPSISPS